MPEMSAARISELVIGGSRANWTQIGINFSHDGVFAMGEMLLRIDEALPSGLHSWALSNVDSSVDSIDGIPTTDFSVNALRTENENHDFALKPLGVDHVVVNTPDLERTSLALHEATGAELKRIRDAGNGMRQGFHRMGDVIVEIVSTPSMPKGNASLWGFVLNVADVNEAADYLGPDVLSPPKPAVQKNRLIATFRSGAGLGVPVALMSDI